MKIKTTLALLLAAVSVSACVDEGPRQMPQYARAAPVQQGVEGTWSDSNGLASTFNGGQFVTKTTDGTNTQMASGTYTSQPNGVIQINLYSNIKKTTSLVNCQLVNPEQLNCTSDSNSQFSLHRG